MQKQETQIIPETQKIPKRSKEKQMEMHKTKTGKTEGKCRL